MRCLYDFHACPLVCFPGCSGGEGRKEEKRGNIGCEGGGRLGEEGKRTGGEEEFSVGEFTKSTVICVS